LEGGGGDDRWYLPKDAWSTVREAGEVMSFKSGGSKVLGSLEIEVTDTGTRWRFAKVNKFMVNKDSISEHNRSHLAFKTISSLFINELESFLEYN